MGFFKRGKKGVKMNILINLLTEKIKRKQKNNNNKKKKNKKNKKKKKQKKNMSQNMY